MMQAIVETIGAHTFRLLPIPGGPFRMGSPKEFEQANANERPQHLVTVPSFYLSEFPVTQALWAAVALAVPDYEIVTYPSGFEGEDCPVDRISWNEIDTKFLPALESLTKRPYRLPTEAEWEYAARGGQHWQENYLYVGSDRLQEVGWYGNNSGGRTRPVGLKIPNVLGLFDMSGNIKEWCEDDWHYNYYNNPPQDGTAWVDTPRGHRRVTRGGDWGHHDPLQCRAAFRHNRWPPYRWLFNGFRLALSLQPNTHAHPIQHHQP